VEPSLHGRDAGAPEPFRFPGRLAFGALGTTCPNRCGKSGNALGIGRPGSG